MAINTAQRRRSMLNFASDWQTQVVEGLVDSQTGAGDRLTRVGLFSGFGSSAAPVDFSFGVPFLDSLAPILTEIGREAKM